MASKWKKIWGERKDRFDKINMEDPRELFLELKRIDGFDVQDGGMSYEALFGQYRNAFNMMRKYHRIESVFEIGCGSGANLFLFSRDGIEVGGMDYSSAMIEIAQKIFTEDTPYELICDEAKNLPVDKKYDAIFSNSVFSYFPSEEYAAEVLNRAYEKARYTICLLDLHDIEKKKEFIDYHRRIIDDYDERYKDLDKFFYRKRFFEDWAKEHDCEIVFEESKVEGYWNNEFIFNVTMYKK